MPTQTSRQSVLCGTTTAPAVTPGGAELMDVERSVAVDRALLAARLARLLADHGVPASMAISTPHDCLAAVSRVKGETLLQSLCFALLSAMAQLLSGGPPATLPVDPTLCSFGSTSTRTSVSEHALLSPASQRASRQSTFGGSLSTASGGGQPDRKLSAGNVSECKFSSSEMLNTEATDLVKHTSQLWKTKDEEGNTIINRYVVIGELGQGAYGKVKLAVDEENFPVAIKIVRKSLLKKSGGAQALQREIAVMKKLKHRNVVPLYEVIDDPESEKLYLVMKYVDQGPIRTVELDNTCDPIDAGTLKEVAIELLSGLSYLHKRGVAHRDIKPDNILMDAAGTPYFADFGVSAIIDKDNPGAVAVQGTPLFMPPELFTSDGALSVDLFKADVWSLGVTFYLLLYGQAPFIGTNYLEISESVRTSVLALPDTSSTGAVISADWQDLLRGMLCKDPAKRLTVKQVKKHRAVSETMEVTAAEIEAATSVALTGLANQPLLKFAARNESREVLLEKSVGLRPPVTPLTPLAARKYWQVLRDQPAFEALAGPKEGMAVPGNDKPPAKPSGGKTAAGASGADAGFAGSARAAAVVLHPPAPAVALPVGGSASPSWCADVHPTISFTAEAPDGAATTTDASPPHGPPPAVARSLSIDTTLVADPLNATATFAAEPRAPLGSPTRPRYGISASFGPTNLRVRDVSSIDLGAPGDLSGNVRPPTLVPSPPAGARQRSKEAPGAVDDFLLP